MKTIKRILTLSLLGIVCGLSFGFSEAPWVGSALAKGIEVRRAASEVESGLRVESSDGSSAEGKYTVTDKGSGCISTEITASGDYSITQIDSSQSLKEQIVIGPNVEGTIRLSGLNLLYSTSSSRYRESTIQVDPTSNVTLYFDGDNIINRNGDYYPGIGYYGNKDEFTGSLTLEGSETGETYICGALYGCGIGGVEKTMFSFEGGKENADTVGNIVINSGNFRVKALGSGGSAIGSGAGGNVKGITINGGNLELNADGSKSSFSGAVLGSGDSGVCDRITINGGTVVASNLGPYNSSNAAAIGSGDTGECKEIVINGGNILAESYSAPAIGLGQNYRSTASPDQKITINGGTVTATVSTGTSAGIGYHPNNRVPVSRIEINGGSVKSSFSVDPVNRDDERLYLAELDNMAGVSGVYVDGQDFHIDSNHSEDDSSLYLYLPGRDSELKVTDGDGEKTYEAKFSGDGSFEIGSDKPNEAPVIEAEDKYIEVGTVITDELLLSGVTVTDDNDEELRATVRSHDVDSSSVGTYEVTYEAEDSGGLVATKTVKVYVYQAFENINKAPVISASDRTVAYGSVFDEAEALKGVTAYDEEDEDLTSEIVVESNPVDTSEPGEYEVEYSVTDSQGAKSYLTVKVTVEAKPPVTEEDKPVITVDEIALRVGDSFDDSEALKHVSAVDKDGEKITDIEVIVNEVDTSEPGEYRLGFRVTDKYGVSQEKYVTIVVSENTDGSQEPGDGAGDSEGNGDTEKPDGDQGTEVPGEDEPGTTDNTAIIVLASVVAAVAVIGAISLAIILKSRKSK